ncbi:MAG: fatty-acyl-CoA synthase [Halieaceae bacterium]|jgi:fatty-acyl-CoA synthase
MMTRDECQAVIDRTNQASVEVAMQFDVTIADRFEQAAQEDPSKCFLIYDDVEISWGELNQHANAFARAGIAKGMKRGDTAALMMENRPEFFYAWVGMLKLGVATALINTETRSSALNHALATVSSKILIIGSECLDRYVSGASLSSLYPTLVVADSWSDKGYRLPTGTEEFDYTALNDKLPAYDSRARKGLKNSDIACFIYTSGTTGLPKAAYITHSKWLSTGARWLQMSSMQADDIFYCVLPLFHGAALMSLFSTVLALRSVCVLRRRFSAKAFWPDIARHQISVFIYVGEICRYLVNSPIAVEQQRHSLRIAIGSGMGLDTWNAFVGRFGSNIEIYEGWGSTEANCNMCNFDNRPGSCGRVPYWDRTFMRLVKYSVEEDYHPRNSSGCIQLAAVGEPGELLGQIHSASGEAVSPFDGYSDRAASELKLLRDVFQPGDCWFRSGDLFRCDAEGYFYFVDRIGDTYRWKSENISTTEVVQQLSGYEAAELINIYGVKVSGHEGRAGMAAIVMQSDEIFDPAGFFAEAKANLASYAIPLFVRILAQMDMTGTYKLRKIDLQHEGYDMELCGPMLYVADMNEQTYRPCSPTILSELGLPYFAIDGSIKSPLGNNK